MQNNKFRIILFVIPGYPYKISTLPTVSFKTCCSCGSLYFTAEKSVKDGDIAARLVGEDKGGRDGDPLHLHREEGRRVDVMRGLRSRGASSPRSALRVGESVSRRLPLWGAAKPIGATG